MPSLNLSIAPDAGPLLMVYVAVSVPYADTLRKFGKPVPAQLHGSFLIDTGASCTCVDPKFLAPLGLRPTSMVPMLTAGTNDHKLCPQYDVSIHIPNTGNIPPLFLPATPLVLADLNAQGIDGLLGRDILDTCTLIYNGTAGTCSLAY